jgi:hypothetical protein
MLSKLQKLNILFLLNRALIGDSEMDWYTLFTAVVGYVGVPLLGKIGLTLTAAQLQTLEVAVFGGAVGVVHYFETLFKQKNAAAAQTAAVQAAVANATQPAHAQSATVIDPLNPNAGVGGVVKMVPLFLAIGMGLLAVTGLSGCATLANLFTPTAAPYVQVAVDVAVAAAVGTDTSTQQAKATKIKTIAQQLLAADSSTTATLAAIETTLNAKLVSLNLPPGDLAAAELLTNTLEAVLQAQLANPTTAAKLGTAQVAVADILNDVITATSAYGI